MEFILSIIIAAVFLVLMIIMFILGYKEALKTKVEDPFVVQDHIVGEGWENDTFIEFEELIDILGREPTEDELREFLNLVEEGYHGETLLKKFMERIKKKEHH